MAAVLPFLPAVASAAGSIFQAKQQSDIAEEMGRQQQLSYEYNARVSEQNAAQSRQAAAASAEQLRERNRRILASSASSYLKSGVQLSGSAETVLENQATSMEYDALTAIFTGEVQARGAESQAQIQRYYGQNAAYAADVRSSTLMKEGLIKAGTTIKNITPAASYRF